MASHSYKSQNNTDVKGAWTVYVPGLTNTFRGIKEETLQPPSSILIPCARQTGGLDTFIATIMIFFFFLKHDNNYSPLPQ